MALEGTHEREHHAPNEVDIVLNLEVAEAVDDAGIPADEQMTFELGQQAQGDLDEMEEFRLRRERRTPSIPPRIGPSLSIARTPLTPLTPLTLNAVTNVPLTLSVMTHVAVNALPAIPITSPAACRTLVGIADPSLRRPRR